MFCFVILINNYLSNVFRLEFPFIPSLILPFSKAECFSHNPWNKSLHSLVNCQQISSRVWILHVIEILFHCSLGLVSRRDYISIAVAGNIRFSSVDVNPYSCLGPQHEYCEQVFHWNDLVWRDRKIKPSQNHGNSYLDLRQSKALPYAIPWCGWKRNKWLRWPVFGSLLCKPQRIKHLRILPNMRVSMKCKNIDVEKGTFR